MQGDMKLVIEIQNKNPVDILDLSAQMRSIGEEYKNHLRNHTEISPDRASLYIKEVKSGSIIAELMALGMGSLYLFQNTNTIVTFTENLISLYQWLSGKTNNRPEHLDRVTLQNSIDIVETIAKDNGSNMNLHVENNTGNIIVQHYSISSNDANAMQNTARREIQNLNEPITGVHRNVVMYWDQAKNQQNSKSGDRVRIDSLSHKSVKTIFADDLKKQAFYDLAHPFDHAYLVDVQVETVEGKPVLYKILSINETIERDND